MDENELNFKERDMYFLEKSLLFLRKRDGEKWTSMLFMINLLLFHHSPSNPAEVGKIQWEED